MDYDRIKQLLENGISEDEILSSLTKSIPSLAKKAASLFSGGWKSLDILNLFSKDRQVQKTLQKGFKPSTPSEIAAMRLRDSYNNIPRSQNEQSKEELQGFTKQVAPYAIGALSAPMAEAALGRALPHVSSLINGISSPQKTTSTNTLQEPTLIPKKNAIPQQPPSINAPNITQPAQPVQPEGISNPRDYLEKLGIREKVDALLQAKNPPESIAAAIGVNRSGKQGKIDPELVQVIDEYAKQTKANNQNLPKPTESVEAPKIEPENIIEPEQIKPIQKNQTVASPQGIGEVKEIRNGKALLDIDGKRHVVPEEELEGEPADLEEVTRELVNKIPENMKSTAIQSATHVPLPDNRSLTLMKFYDGKIAWYLDVPEELYDSIALGTYQPKGEEKTGIAEYKPGVFDSRGAGFSKEIRDNPLYSKENKGKTWGYAKNSYDALSIIQPILNKMSKERYDEAGNIIPTKKRKKRA